MPPEIDAAVFKNKNESPSPAVEEHVAKDIPGSTKSNDHTNPRPPGPSYRITRLQPGLTAAQRCSPATNDRCGAQPNQPDSRLRNQGSKLIPWCHWPHTSSLRICRQLGNLSGPKHFFSWQEPHSEASLSKVFDRRRKRQCQR